ncbi:tripartite tricarboxylate transporter TctB family protein [[Clostridium] symbiosum]|uniref:tripartite tricarboxylate transporter TctB family protein n=1 Tax=Clostridium symbiosum TaxID=1512 RepID=UPI001D05EA06|nr:tripartite tricarboxylate transporter TctB family protein [[Clostridium] symbiosum]MCB6607963.1 tripartite tricarboxylate transporter TctB family protein [[Clostridium] symbiosum]MCB6931394.1 tripartite tricarboxylate transporter TctB family protein [[Clostridium] symbiosum]
MKKYNLIAAAVFALIGMGMIVTIRGFEYNGLSEIGAGFWPRVLGVLMILLSAAYAVETLCDKEEPVVIDFKSEGLRRVYGMCGILLGFAVLIKVLGFFCGAAFFIPSCMWVFGERSKKKVFVITAGVVLFVYVVFVALLQIGLPRGFLM